MDDKSQPNNEQIQVLCQKFAIDDTNFAHFVVFWFSNKAKVNMCWCKYIWKHICNTIVHCTVNSRTTERYTPAFSLLLLTIYRVFFFRALEFLRALAVKPTVKVNPGVWHLFSVYFAIFSCKNLLTCSLKIYAQDSSSVLQSYLPHFYRLNIFSDEAHLELNLKCGNNPERLSRLSCIQRTLFIGPYFFEN